MSPSAPRLQRLAAHGEHDAGHLVVSVTISFLLHDFGLHQVGVAQRLAGAHARGAPQGPTTVGGASRRLAGEFGLRAALDHDVARLMTSPRASARARDRDLDRLDRGAGIAPLRARACRSSNVTSKRPPRVVGDARERRARRPTLSASSIGAHLAVERDLQVLGSCRDCSARSSAAHDALLDLVGGMRAARARHRDFARAARVDRDQPVAAAPPRAPRATGTAPVWPRSGARKIGVFARDAGVLDQVADAHDVARDDRPAL